MDTAKKKSGAVPDLAQRIVTVTIRGTLGPEQEMSSVVARALRAHAQQVENGIASAEAHGTIGVDNLIVATWNAYYEGAGTVCEACGRPHREPVAAKWPAVVS